MGMLVQSALITAFNPLALSTLILMTTIICLWARSTQAVIQMGGCFIFFSMLLDFLTNLGGLDSLMNIYALRQAMLVLIFFIACFFILLGFCHLCDWWAIKRQGDRAVLKIPMAWVFKFENDANRSGSLKGSLKEKLLWFLVSGVLAIVLGFIKYLAPQNYFLLIEFFNLISKEEILKAYALVLFYISVYSLPMILTWGMLVVLSRGKKWKEDLLKFTSFIKIASSALLISTGLGLIYIYNYNYLFIKKG